LNGPEAGFHFVPEGRLIVARRFIAGLAIHRIFVPEGRLKVDLGRQGTRIGVWEYGRAGLWGGSCASRKSKEVYAIGATRQNANTPIRRSLFPDSLRDAFIFMDWMPLALVGVLDCGLGAFCGLPCLELLLHFETPPLGELGLQQVDSG
jgi:hypothetical protein